MKCSLGISNFLVKISSVSHSVVFLYLFALIAEEGFLISPCYSLELHTACCDSVFKVGRFHIVFSLIEDVFNTMHVCMLSHFNRIWLLATLWTVARQASLSMGFSMQGLPNTIVCHKLDLLQNSILFWAHSQRVFFYVTWQMCHRMEYIYFL